MKLFSARIFNPYVLIFAILTALILAIIFNLFILPKFTKVSFVSISNLSEKGATISFVSDKLIETKVIISQDNKFPLLPILVPLLWDERGKGQRDTHFLNLKNLQPSQKYQFRIYQGLIGIYQGTLTTGPILRSLSVPNPVYGTVKSQKDKTNIYGAIIYLQIFADKKESRLLSTLTNSQGGWSIDLANAREINLSKSFQVTDDAVEKVIVEDGKNGRGQAYTINGQDKPWPDILILPNTGK